MVFWWGISSFNPGLLCGSRWDKARAGLACITTAGWLVLLGGRGGCGAVSLSVVCNAGALFSSFPSCIGVPLEGLRIGCGVTRVSSLLRNLRFRKVILPDLSTLIQYWLWGRVSMTWPVILHRPLFVHGIDTKIFNNTFLLFLFVHRIDTKIFNNTFLLFLLMLLSLTPTE